MNYKRLKEYLKVDKYLLLLILITSLITGYLISIQIQIGVPYWDVFNYLNDALYFAGEGMGNLSYLPPIIPFLTSLVFRLGYLSSNVIFILDGIIFIIGVIGLYMLFKLRFNRIQSLTGSLIFVSLPLVISWAVAGAIDVPAISFSIWAIYFTILGVKKDSKFLYLMLILFGLAVLTKYKSVLLVFPIALYILINNNYIKNVKKIGLISLALFILVTTILLLFYDKSSNLTTLLILFTTTAFNSSTLTNDVAYNPNILYYLGNMFNYISIGPSPNQYPAILAPFLGPYSAILNPSEGLPSPFSYIIGLLTLTGLIIYIHKIMNILKVRRQKIEIKSLNFIKIVLLWILIIIFIITFAQITYLISEVIFFAICYITYTFLKDLKIKNLDIDFLFISWFMSYLILHSVLAIKVDRYFITMTPALAYFIVLGLKELLDKFDYKINNTKLKTWGIYAIVALLFLSTGLATYYGHTPQKCFTQDIEQSSAWLKNYDSQYNEKIFFSDYNSATSWYLKKQTHGAFPRFYKNSIEFSNYLKKNKADYYIDTLSYPKLDIPRYHKLKTIGTTVIYEKDNVQN